MTLGGYDLARFASGNLTWHKINQAHSWWTLDAESFGFGNQAPISGTGHVVIVDTGTSYLSISRTLYRELRRLLSWMNCGTANANGLEVVYCRKPVGVAQEELMKRLNTTIWLQIDGVKYSVLLSSSIRQNSRYIVFKILVNSSNMVILGLNFLQQYYSVFD